jgi:hypothetical protein
LIETLDEKKSIGLNNIPNKLLKIAADVVAPPLTENKYFPSLFILVYFPMNGRKLEYDHCSKVVQKTPG